ncbi:SRPBCC family protein [Pseudomonas protegens]|uniref:SRPBCC family protein n=1 Tax=Pseudomonas TaxID=286 RepID=UPI00030B6054|nr:SRPBCC family protein [Pseudomonas protegens]APC21559.1 sterol desaturase [Pseudomonas protegens]MCU1765619.1 SRPBCC family protein [Pseudomonas protegens]MDS9873287.1 SRPBCC family protein [Pseudomonas protegens]PNV94363.1 sterol desaturase [Pseudomonas protegens]ROM27754.1 sterol desaturase [Pseudomonas protegens]
MRETTQHFRQQYRAAVSPRYNPWLHGGFVLAYGLLCIGLLCSTLSQVQPLEWLAVPVALLFFNLCIYVVHRWLGHHKQRFARMFYARHTGDHHSFFAPGLMAYEGYRDWRVILFPAWLIVVHSLLFALPLWALLRLWNGNVAALFASCTLLGYLAYEVFHACEHLPANHPLARLPWVRQMRRLHELHHRRELMQERNFNIVLPLMDWLFGTLHWQPQEPPAVTSTPDEATPMTRMQHQVDIPRSAASTLAYAASSRLWPQWHPSSLKVEGDEGPLFAGQGFEEDIHAGGRSGHLSWTVEEYLPGHRWRASARGDHGLHLQVTYECQPLGAQHTRFVRTLEYGFDNLLMRLGNQLLFKRRIERESAASLLALCEMAQQAIPLPATEAPGRPS